MNFHKQRGLRIAVITASIVAIYLFLSLGELPPEQLKARLIEAVKDPAFRADRADGVMAEKIADELWRGRFVNVLLDSRIEAERIVPGPAIGSAVIQKGGDSIVIIIYPGGYGHKGPYVVARFWGGVSGNLVLEVAKVNMENLMKEHTSRSLK